MTLKLRYEPPEMEELELHDFILAEKKNDKSVKRKEDLDDTEEEDEI